MTHHHYVLENGVPRAVPLLEWAQWFQTHDADRLMEKTEWNGVTVSTVFLGIDHNWSGGPPILFETMVFGGPLNEDCRRYRTVDEARAGHLEMVERVKLDGNPPVCRDCGKKEDVTFDADPYASELYDDETPVWLCGDCRHERAMGV